MEALMTGREFFNAVSNGNTDLLQLFLNILEEVSAQYCVIGGLAVNAYAEPVVSLDLDIVLVAGKQENVISASEAAGLKVQEFEHSINLSTTDSDLRIQIQTDHRYQDFLDRAEMHQVLGYNLRVAAPEDVLTGKVWAWSDSTRRKSKRQKDLADILRLVESHPRLRDLLPPELLAELD
jgi:hypothetical protein